MNIKTNTITTLAAALLLLLTRADVWACSSPVSEVVTLKQGEWEAEIVPLYRDRPAGITVRRGGQLVWTQAITDNPYGWGGALSERGELALFRGWDHGDVPRPNLVVYDPAGKVLLQRRLEEILTGAEMAAVQQQLCGHYWVGKPGPVFSRGVIGLELPGSGPIAFHLDDGRQTRSGAKQDTPSDDERLWRYLGGTTPFVVQFFETRTATCLFTTASVRCEARGGKKEWSKPFGPRQDKAARAASRALFAARGDHARVKLCFSDVATYCYWLYAPDARSFAGWRKLTGAR